GGGRSGQRHASLLRMVSNRFRTLGENGRPVNRAAVLRLGSALVAAGVLGEDPVERRARLGDHLHRTTLLVVGADAEHLLGRLAEAEHRVAQDDPGIVLAVGLLPRRAEPFPVLVYV